MHIPYFWHRNRYRAESTPTPIRAEVVEAFVYKTLLSPSVCIDICVYVCAYIYISTNTCPLHTERKDERALDRERERDKQK